MLPKLLAGVLQDTVMNFSEKSSGNYFFCRFAAPEGVAQLVEHIARHRARLGI